MRYLTLVRLFLGLSLFLGSVVADVRVRGHFRKDGTYVAPHMRSSPNSTTLDNWSTKGNINPYTGQVGTKNPVEGVGVGNQYTPYTPTRSVQTSGAGLTPIGSSSVKDDEASSSVNTTTQTSSSTISGPTEAQWKKLEERLLTTKTGIPPEEVESLLGKPQSKDGPSEVYALTGDTWRYPSGGWITFWKQSGTVREVGMFSGNGSRTTSAQFTPMTEPQKSELELRSRIKELEEKVSRLESLLQQRRTTPRNEKSVGTVPEQGTGPSAQHWIQIRSFMPKSEVLKIMGNPLQISNQGGGEFWYYPGGGWIQFMGSGEVWDYGGYSFGVTP